jgi:monoamine oxidase
MAPSADVEIAVVGAGFAGLAAAHDLARAGRDVLVLEARDRVGGRVAGADLEGGERVEIGGEWIGPTQDRLAAMAAEVGVETFLTHDEGDNLLEWRGRRRRYRGTIPRLSPLVLADVEVVRRRLERMASGVPLEAPWDAPGAARLDAQSLGSWLDRHARTRTARQLVAVVCRTVWGAEPHELSLLYVLFYIRSAGSFSMLTDVAGGAQESRFVGGSELVAERVAAQLGDRVRLEAPVRAITRDEHGVELVADGVTVRARRAIVAIPPVLVNAIEHRPALPAARVQLGQRTPMGAIAKVSAVYDAPFWRADGLSGQALTDRGPVTLTFDNSPPSGRPGVLLGFVGGDDARAYERLSPERRREAAMAGFARLFGPRAARPRDVVEKRWTADEWSAGGPMGNPVPGAWARLGPALRAHAGRVHWAGTETATVWCGFIDGAVRSGERAAAEAIAAETAEREPASAAG